MAHGFCGLYEKLIQRPYVGFQEWCCIKGIFYAKSEIVFRKFDVLLECGWASKEGMIFIFIYLFIYSLLCFALAIVAYYWVRHLR